MKGYAAADATAHGPRGGTLRRRCAMAGKGKEPSFEEALKGLEAVVERLESGEPPLEESIRLFEEGMRLSETCRKRLDEADRKIELLLRKPGGISRETAEEDDILGKEE
jgi:exodeoxyribonuclease VII small subunit